MANERSTSPPTTLYVQISKIGELDIQYVVATNQTACYRLVLSCEPLVSFLIGKTSVFGFTRNPERLLLIRGPHRSSWEHLPYHCRPGIL